jgi:hypothetical protein
MQSLKSAAMLIYVSDTELVDELCAHYDRSGFRAKAVGGGMVELDRPDAPSVEQGRREITMHLRIWEILNPGRTVEVVG